MPRLPIILLAVAWIASPSLASAVRFHPASDHGIPRGFVSWRVLGLPVRALAGVWNLADRAAPGTALSRDDGWTRVGFPLRDHGRGLGLSVSGQTQIGEVEIVFEDGGIERVQVERARTYGHGLYELARFDGDRDVMLVRFEARARSPRARVQVLLMRDAPVD